MTRPIPSHSEETTAERRARHFAMLRELQDLNMDAARDAGARIKSADPQTPDAASPTLALARATRAVSQLIHLENRVAAGDFAQPRATTPDLTNPGLMNDPRREMLRKVLVPLTRDLEPARRTATRRAIDLAIEDAIDLDLDDAVPLGQVAEIIAQKFGLRLDIAKLPDELLGIDPRPGPDHDPPPF